MSNWWKQIQERLKHEERKLYGADNLFIKSMQGEVRQTPFVVEPWVAQILADIERSRTGSLRCLFTGQIDEMGTWEPPERTAFTVDTSKVLRKSEWFDPAGERLFTDESLGLPEPLTLEKLQADYLRALLSAAARGLPLSTPATLNPQRYDEFVAAGLLKPTDDNPNTAHPVAQNGSVIETIVVYKQEYIPE